VRCRPCGLADCPRCGALVPRWTGVGAGVRGGIGAGGRGDAQPGGRVGGRGCCSGGVAGQGDHRSRVGEGGCQCAVAVACKGSPDGRDRVGHGRVTSFQSCWGVCAVLLVRSRVSLPVSAAPRSRSGGAALPGAMRWSWVLLPVWRWVVRALKGMAASGGRAGGVAMDVGCCRARSSIAWSGLAVNAGGSCSGRVCLRARQRRLVGVIPTRKSSTQSRPVGGADSCGPMARG
jgi:hypothetical protein